MVILTSEIVAAVLENYTGLENYTVRKTPKTFLFKRKYLNAFWLTEKYVRIGSH